MSVVDWFVAEADRRGLHSMGTALLFAGLTAQRRGDLIALPWSALEGDTLKVRQAKTEALVDVPLLPELRERLAATPRG